MNKKEAIKYLKQLYPNGGHCWLDDQRMEAIGMAIKSLQEEPVSIWHDASVKPNVKEKGGIFVITSLNDEYVGSCYYDRNDVTITIGNYDKWAYINDLVNLSNVQRTVKNCKEEPASEDKMTISKEWFDNCKKSWYNEGYIDGEYNRDRQFENSVSEDFEEALAKEWKGYNDRGAATVDALEDNTQELAFAKGFYRGAKWQEEKDNICYEEIFEEGAEWKADEFEKERLKQCDTLTKEQAKIESDFVTNFIKENNCTPTFIDAIEYGMKLKLKDVK